MDKEKIKTFFTKVKVFIKKNWYKFIVPLLAMFGFALKKSQNEVKKEIKETKKEIKEQEKVIKKDEKKVEEAQKTLEKTIEETKEVIDSHKENTEIKQFLKDL